MMELSSTKLAVAIGGLALSLTGGAGIASAGPDLGPIVNTTCNYSQVMAAANAQDPAATAQFNASPQAQSYLRQFLAAPPDERQQMAQLIASSNQLNVGLMEQIFTTCNNF